MTEEVTKPTSFEDLKPSELYRSAIADFALPVEEADKNKKKVLLAAFVEGGVTWKDYVDQHPEVAPEPTAPPEPVAQPQNVVTAEPTSKESLSAAPEQVRVAQNPISEGAPYLIKMTRENPLYEVRGYRFTQSHPYALVSPRDAQYILSKEDGFRQAFPDELEEFYS